MTKPSLRQIWRQYRRETSPVPAEAISPHPAPKFLLTVGFGSLHAAAARRLERQAQVTGWFTNVFCITEETTAFQTQEFLRCSALLRQEHKKGFGLWSWKPFLVQAVMAQLPDGAHLYYVDAGCEISALGRARFMELDHLLAQSKGLFFELPFVEHEWTKPELFNIFRNIENTRQIQATWFGLKKHPVAVSLVQRWEKLAWMDNCTLLKDPPTVAGVEAPFAHRHDQSLLSCLLKTEFKGIEPLPWEDFFAPWLYHVNSRALLAPVHALRSRGGGSQIDELVARSTVQACLLDHTHASLWKSLQCLPYRLRHRLKDEAVLMAQRLK